MEDNQKLAENDHRRLGKELDLFVMSPLVGSGLPIFTPRGTILREELDRYVQELRQNEGYKRVWSPHIAKRDLYETSGHWQKFANEWLKVVSQETKDQLVMKPMNCPHHIQIYASHPRSYRELPIKYMETTTDYRDEKSGELLGLARVRSVTQDDSHVFCTPDQIKEIMSTLVRISVEFYKAMDLPLKVRLSFRDDSDEYLGDEDLWNRAQTIIEEVAKETGLEYYVGKGEAAFYGPKIDFMATDITGREFQVATPQLDFVMPERFDLKYTDQDGSEETPVMVHFALLGSIERFLAVYIEHTEGRFPLWLAPEQLRVIAVSDEDSILKVANSVVEKAKAVGLRSEVDDSNQSVAKKIRDAEVMKVPYTVVIGAKELDSQKITPRVRHDLAELPEMTAEELLQKLSHDAKARQ